MELSLRELVDWMYFVLAEHRDEKEMRALDNSLEPVIATRETAQQERLATIAAMGGAVR